MSLIDLKKTTFNIKDGGSNSVEVKIGEGNLTYSEKVNRVYHKNKGALDEVRDGDEEPMDVKFEFQWEYLTSTSSGATTPTVEEALKNTGAASAWETTGGDCDPFAVDLEVEYDPTINAPEGCTDLGETILLQDFRYETLEHDLRAAQVSCSGKCNTVEPVISRA